MSIIQITPDVRISVDTLNYTLERRVVFKEGKRKGEEDWQIVGFYPDLRSSCLALLNRHLALVADIGLREDVKAIVAAVNGAERRIIEAIKVVPASTEE